MKYSFKYLIIHNFLSYGHSELNLSDKGYCLVSGTNMCLSDGAKSNGSGKSSWSSAICWALTGETVQGLKSNLKNINVEEKECYVTLLFDADKDTYEITRYSEPKAALNIKLNGKDISGKTFKESEKILAEYLPDLTSQLIASVIILGQGLPNKFTANTPAKRKEILETLSKSNFMINDLKTRVSDRLATVLTSKRLLEDTKLKLTTKLGIEEETKKKLEDKITELSKPVDFDIQIDKLTEQYNIESNKRETLENNIKLKNDELNTISQNLSKINSEKTAKTSQRFSDFINVKSGFTSTESTLSAKIKIVNDKIKEVESTPDICPVCHRPMPADLKPSVDNEKAELKSLNEQLTAVKNELSIAETNYKNDVNKIELESNIKSKDLTEAQKLVKQELAKLYAEPKFDIATLAAKIATLKAQRDTRANDLNKAREDFQLSESRVKKIQDDILYNDEKNQVILEHIDVLNKMNIALSRDFRGFLLSNVITFIAAKSKEYAKTIFGNDGIEFMLDGNDIDIMYSGKYFENLSGGEKQKVDLIIQFALRDMMSQYLDFSSNILVLDEITDYLDAAGCEKVLDLITTKLEDLESIFIISHRADELQIPYDTEINIMKNEKGISRII